jgi:hypothetical protein
MVVVFGSIICVFFKADGYSDPFYMRFTTPKQNALILGSSKAAQGLMPKILNENLQRNDIYNYAFTLHHSPYGPTYFNSIKRKLKNDSKNGIFIITVDPWSITSDSETPNDSTKFEELNLCLEKTKKVDVYPNFEYLINSYTRFYIKILYNNSPMYLHKDGWLESSININAKDGTASNHRTLNMTSEMQKARLDASILRYLKKKETYKYSRFRERYLVKTIEFLKSRGDVYLVRLPIHPEMAFVEQELMPDFNRKMNRISEESKIRYFDMMSLNSNYIFNDGNHLNRVSSKDVSLEVAQWITNKTD